LAGCFRIADARATASPAAGGSGANFPPLRSDESGKTDADDGVIIGNDDTGDAIRYHVLNGKKEFACERLRRIAKKIVRPLMTRESSGRNRI
jgi:hypothetical protein